MTVKTSLILHAGHQLESSARDMISLRCVTCGRQLCTVPLTGEQS